MKRSFWLSVDGLMGTFIALLIVFQLLDILILTMGVRVSFTQREMNDNLCLSAFILVLTVMKTAVAVRIRPEGGHFLLTLSLLAFTVWLSLANLAELGATGSSFLADGERLMQMYGLASTAVAALSQTAIMTLAKLGRREDEQTNKTPCSG